MNTQEQAYIEGFVKRATEHGLSAHEAIELFKQAAPGVAVPAKPAVKPRINPAHINEAMPAPKALPPNFDPRTRKPLSPQQLDDLNY
jgi:hypothetical protein